MEEDGSLEEVHVVAVVWLLEEEELKDGMHKAERQLLQCKC